MQDVLKKLAPSLRSLGFRGSGQNYRKTEREFVLVINFQGSRWGDNFYVNVGAQPAFIPAEGNADLKKLKEYECVLHRRVRTEWPWEMSDDMTATLVTEVTSTQAVFFAHAMSLPVAIQRDSTEELLRKFCVGTTKARAALHLARAAVALGHVDAARDLVSKGLELASDRATVLRSELQSVLDS